MKMLLTSAGIKNASIHRALLDLLGKPIAEASALCIPTASYAMPNGPVMAWRFISGQEPDCPMCELGWKSLGVLELSALPGIEKQLSADLLPGEAGASVGSDSGKKARVLPAPFPSLAGRSSGVASVRKEWTETGEIGEFGPLHLARRVDLCADCWGGTSRSGKNIRRTVLARIALGALR